MTGSRLSMLVVIYGLGFAAVYGAMALLYVHAWRLRDALELNELESFDTRYIMTRLFTLSVFGVVAAGLACVPILRCWSSFIYLLLFPTLRISRATHDRRRAAYLTNTA